MAHFIVLCKIFPANFKNNNSFETKLSILLMTHISKKTMVESQNTI